MLKEEVSLLESFWKLWRDKYLLNLQERSQINLKAPRVNTSKMQKAGDIIQIKEQIHRENWKIGKITKLIKSVDGNVRATKGLQSV